MDDGILFFAEGAKKDGKYFFNKREIRFAKKIAKQFPSHPVDILFIKEVIGFDPPNLYSELLKNELLLQKVPLEFIKIVPGYGQSTISEIVAAEKWFLDYKKKRVASFGSICHASSLCG
ncbi:MAG: hypothetical protein PHF44_02800 [Candidatus Pacebacteria bacterium]|nr:hypothetical protein [Candidatus Paceibacterota bacterium]